MMSHRNRQELLDAVRARYAHRLQRQFMGRRRFKRLGEDSCFGRMVYDRVIPREHFLMRLDEIIPWQRFTYKLVTLSLGQI